MKNILLALILLIILTACEELPEPTYVDAIFIMDDNGSNVTHLIDGRPGSVQFTLDGEKIITTNSGIYSMNLDGFDYKPLIDSLLIDSSIPLIYLDSLSCLKIIFAAYSMAKSNCDIYIMDIDGANLQNLTNSPDIRERYPHFSPDRDSIVYTTDSSDTIKSEKKHTISIMGKSGNDKREVISNIGKGIYSYPIFSKNQEIIYYKCSGELKGLYSIKTDGTENTLLFGEYPELYPISMSEDGSKIVFSADSHIYIIYNDGSDIIDLGYGRNPIISSDGTKIVFDGVKIMKSDGSGINGLEYGSKPRFSPDDSKIVYIGQRKINKKRNKGIVF